MSATSVDLQVKALTKDPSKFRNIMIIAHVDHGKTTLTDGLCSQAGLLSDALAGKQLLLDKAKVEKARGITVYAGSISLPYEGHLINLKDTPGHADFSMEVDKGSRAIDGALVLVDAKEGVMTQSEAVIGLAVKQNIPMVLVVNKIDRLIRELNSTPQEVYNRLVDVLAQVNGVVAKFRDCTTPYFDLSQNVLMGSGLDRWMISTTLLRARGLKFSDLVSRIMKKDASLRTEFPLAKIVLDTVIQKIAPPSVLQGPRMEMLLGEVPRDLLVADPAGITRALVCDTVFFKGGNLSAVRVMSGTLRKGDLVYCSEDGFAKALRVNKIMIDMTRNKIEIEEIPAGGIVLLPNLGLEVGSTLSSQRGESIIFPKIARSRQSVVSVALSCPSARIPEVLEALKQMTTHDPTLIVHQAEGQVVLSGVGELHLEIAINQLSEDYGIVVQTGSPRVAYSETLVTPHALESKVCRTPNGLNDLAISIAPLPGQIVTALRTENIQRKTLNATLERLGLPKDLAKRCEGRVGEDSIYLNLTKGSEFMDVCREDIIAAISKNLLRGPLLGKPLGGLMIGVTFAKLHCDGKRRGELQFTKVFEEGFKQVFEHHPATLMQPIMTLDVELPAEPTRYMTSVMDRLSQLSGVLEDTEEGEVPGYLRLRYALPLGETFGLHKKMMASCEGRITLNLAFKEYGPVPTDKVIKLQAEKNSLKDPLSK